MELHRPILKPFDKSQFELAEDYTYGDIVVPKGYKTNGANIPRLFWSIYPPNSPEYLSAAVIHDWLCDLEEYNRADDTLLEMMLELNCSKFKANVFYYCCKIYHRIKYGV